MLEDFDLERIRRGYREAVDGREAELAARRLDQARRPWLMATDEEVAEIVSSMGVYVDEFEGVSGHRDSIELCKRLIKRIERDGVCLRKPREDD